MTKYQYSGSDVYVAADEDVQIESTLHPKTYTVRFCGTRGIFYLSLIEDFSKPSRVYGDVLVRRDRILNTYQDRLKTRKSTGVLLVGTKGNGKSLLLKEVCLQGQALGYPIIVINSPFAGDKFNQFIQSVASNQPTIIVFDEFEKVYDEQNDDIPSQEALLTLFDGTYSTNSLFILTSNSRYKIDDHLINRPGRLYYKFDYTTLDSAVIREYCQDNLKDTAEIDSIITVASMMLDFNFDMLVAIVQEMNRYNENLETVLKYLNIDTQQIQAREYEIELSIQNHVMKSYTLKIDPLRRGIGYTAETDYSGDAELLAKLEATHDTHLSVDANNLVDYDRISGTLTFENESETGVKFQFKATPVVAQSFNISRYF